MDRISPKIIISALRRRGCVANFKSFKDGVFIFSAVAPQGKVWRGTLHVAAGFWPSGMHSFERVIKREFEECQIANCEFCRRYNDWYSGRLQREKSTGIMVAEEIYADDDPRQWVKESRLALKPYIKKLIGSLDHAPRY